MVIYMVQNRDCRAWPSRQDSVMQISCYMVIPIQQKLQQVGNTFYLCPGSMGSAEQKYAIIIMDEKGEIDISLRQL